MGGYDGLPQIKPRPDSAYTIGRPLSATNMLLNRDQGHPTYTQKINSLRLDDILAIYDAKCADNDVDYMPIQAKYFVDKFSRECKHRVLHFIEQNMSKNCAKIISFLIRKNHHFIKVNLSRNILKNEGVKHLAYALKSDTQIIHLDVSSNALSDKGIGYLCDMLMTNNTLISLAINSYEGLNRNKVSSNGLVPIRNVLRKNKVSKKTKNLKFLNFLI